MTEHKDEVSEFNKAAAAYFLFGEFLDKTLDEFVADYLRRKQNES